MASSSKGSGGLKGLLKTTGRFCYSVAITASKQGKNWLAFGYTLIGHTAFGIATTSMIVLMPLLFEIARETQVSNKRIKSCLFLHSTSFSHSLLLVLFYERTCRMTR